MEVIIFIESLMKTNRVYFNRLKRKQQHKSGSCSKNNNHLQEQQFTKMTSI